jgi:hypothetical protein
MIALGETHALGKLDHGWDIAHSPARVNESFRDRTPAVGDCHGRGAWFNTVSPGGWWKTCLCCVSLRRTLGFGPDQADTLINDVELNHRFLVA